MSRRLSYVLAWLAVATIALVISWQGVSIVSRQVTTQRPATLSAAELEESIAAATSTTTSSAPTSTTAPDDDGLLGADASTTTTAAGGSPPLTSPPATSTSPTTHRSSTPSPTATTSAAASTRTYNLVGGSAALRFSAAGVTVEYATPKPGFQVEIEPEHGNGVKVEFRSDDHRSRVDGWWENGPVDRVREEAED